MATQVDILAWRIPWAEEPDGLQRTASESGMIEATGHSTRRKRLVGKPEMMGFKLVPYPSPTPRVYSNSFPSSW